MKGKRCDFEYFRIKIYIFIALHVFSLKNIKVNVKRNFSNTTLTSLVLRTTPYLEDFSIFDPADRLPPERAHKPDQSFHETTATYMKMCCFSNEQQPFGADIWRIIVEREEIDIRVLNFSPLQIVSLNYFTTY